MVLMWAVKSILHKHQHALKQKVTKTSVLGHRLALDKTFLMAGRIIVIDNDSGSFDHILVRNVALVMIQTRMMLIMIMVFLHFIESTRHQIMITFGASNGSYAHSDRLRGRQD